MSQHELFDLPDPTVGDVEGELKNRGVKTVVGVDEAGRGPLAGPVVTAAFVLELDAGLPATLDDLDDSKKLDLGDRERLFEEIKTGDSCWAVTSSKAEVIDEINILQATFRAMHRAVEQVVAQIGNAPDVVLVDGNMTIPDGTWNQRALVGGDGRSTAIAAASILAKVTRDRLMCEAGEKWPEYGFSGHKGYPTAGHREALKKHGPCPLHRRSFSGVE